MNNFGVVELASAKTTSAPGWAYVPDTTTKLSSAAALQPTNRKRARNAAGGQSLGDLAARHEARARKEIEALDKDGGGGKEGVIPVPTRPGGRAQGKHTANVRKILQSQKTFANHLDDFLALQAQSEGTGGPSAKRPAIAKDDDILPDSMKVKSYNIVGKNQAERPPSALLVPMNHPLLNKDDAGNSNDTSHSSNGGIDVSDNNPLLASRIPPPPTDEELRALLEHPALSYGEARGTWDEGGPSAGRRYPKRTFCEVCGYWGRVRCSKCGTRACALECLEAHRAECVTRYGI